jgi:hypothetical protein
LAAFLPVLALSLGIGIFAGCVEFQRHNEEPPFQPWWEIEISRFGIGHPQYYLFAIGMILNHPNHPGFTILSLLLFLIILIRAGQLDRRESFLHFVQVCIGYLQVVALVMMAWTTGIQSKLHVGGRYFLL